ncbi:hypothetical protein [Ottowia sp. VDI28]|uniref:hypothetical protein n=1 Tax=Ottowia sp. VDI28 TaxID=3133968 RepID=UPI003C2FF1D2
MIPELVNSHAVNAGDSGADELRALGFDLVVAGQATADVGAAPIYPVLEGIDLVSAGQPVAVVRSPAYPVYEGIDLVRAPTHQVFIYPVSVAASYPVNPALPLEFGTPRLEVGPISFQVGGSMPLEFGAPRTRQRFAAASHHPLELGTPTLEQRAVAAGAWPLEFGTPRATARFGAAGFDLLRAGKATVEVGGATFAVPGHAPLELGTPGPCRYAVMARPAFPLEIGTPRVDRGTGC